MRCIASGAEPWGVGMNQMQPETDYRMKEGRKYDFKSDFTEYH